MCVCFCVVCVCVLGGLVWIQDCLFMGSTQTTIFFRLLDILAGRKDPSGISGQVLIDGTLPPSNFKCMVGYVLQVTPTDDGLPYIKT